MPEGNRPEISVIIPHYEMQPRLRKAVKSIVNQEIDNVEIIIVDDGSESLLPKEIISEGAYPKKIKCLRIPHSGKPVAVNKGVAEARGEYVTILDADDQLPENSLSLRYQHLKEKSADLCIGTFQVAFENQIKSHRTLQNYLGKGRGKLQRELLTNIISPFHQNAMMFHRDLLEDVGRMSPEMIRCQDKDFAVRLIQSAEQVVLLDDPVYIYHRYSRPMADRIKNRLIGMKYHILLTTRYAERWQYLWDVPKVTLTESAKLVHDIFRSYKR